MPAIGQVCQNNDYFSLPETVESKKLQEFAIPLLIFLGAFSFMFFKSGKLRMKYTNYVYFETMCLAPCMPYYPYAVIICVINTFGLGIGITSFYVVTKYKVLIEFGNAYAKDFKWKRRPQFAVLLLGDFVIHWLPFVLLYWFVFGAPRTRCGPKALNLLTSFLTGICHATYYKLLTGSWDPRPGYNLQHLVARPWQWTVAWIGVFSGHVFGAAFLL